MLGHRQAGVGGRVLGDETDPCRAASGRRRASAEHGDRSRGRGEQPDGQMQQRGLARPVGPDQPDDLALGDGEGAVAQRPAPPVPLAQSLGLEDGGHATPSAKQFRKRRAVDGLDVVGTEPGRAGPSAAIGHRREEPGLGGRVGAGKRPDHEGPLTGSGPHQALAFEVAVRLEHRVGVDGQLGHDLLGRRQLVPGSSRPSCRA